MSSSHIIISCGVPQGFTLGLLSVLLCISDIACVSNVLLYPPYPKDRGMLWFYVEAARRPQWCLRDNSKTTGWIVLKFGIHIGSDSVLT